MFSKSNDDTNQLGYSNRMSPLTFTKHLMFWNTLMACGWTKFVGLYFVEKGLPVQTMGNKFPPYFSFDTFPYCEE